MIRLTLLAAAVALCACNPAEVVEPATPFDTAVTVDEATLDVSVEALATVVHPLDPVVARISNNSGVTIYESLCGGQIEGWGYVPGKWNGSYGSGRGCDLESLTLKRNYRAIQPGATVLDTFYINSRAYAGQWRFNFVLQDPNGDLLPLEKRVSQAFTVEP